MLLCCSSSFSIRMMFSSFSRNQRSIRVSSWMRSTVYPFFSACAITKMRLSVGWRERGVDVVHFELLVRDETVHALSDHPQPFLDHFFEVAADGHHLADRFHARTQLARDAFELAEVPARDLANDVVERRFEAGGRALGDVVFQLVQAVAEAQFRGDESERVTGGLGRQRRRAAQPRVHFDHAVVFRVRVEGVLHVALADDPDVADDLDRQFSQFMVFGSSKASATGPRRCSRRCGCPAGRSSPCCRP